MITLRLRWYLFFSASLVRRHWQWLIIALLLIPMDMSFPDIIVMLAWPVVTIVDPSQSWGVRSATLVLFQLIAVLWMYPQRWQISGSELSPYLRTLPFSPATYLAADVSVLLLSTSLVLLPFAVGLALSAKTPLLSIGFTVFYLIECVGLLTLTQLLVLHRRWLSSPATLALVGLLAVSISIQGTWLSWIVLGGVGVGLALGFRSIESRRSYKLADLPSRRSEHAAIALREAKTLHARENGFYIRHMARLLLEEKASVLPRFFSACALAGFIAFLTVQFNFDSRTSTFVAVASTITSALLAGIYSVIHRLRSEAVGYMNTLPVSRNFWHVLDTLTVMIVALAPFSVYAAVLVVNPLSGVVDIILLLVIQCVALMAFRQVLLAETRHKVVLVFSLCFVVSWFALLLI